MQTEPLLHTAMSIELQIPLLWTGYTFTCVLWWRMNLSAPAA